jgi:thioesterase domain-containing protein
VRALAACEGGEIAAVGDGLPRAVKLNKGPEGVAPLFMLSGVHIYRPLAKRLEGVCPAFGIFTHREIEAFGPQADFQPVGQLADDYIRIIRAQQPHGPYRILGYSFSGIIAYEVVQRLRAAGEEVAFLALIDSHLPEWNAGWKQRLVMLRRLWQTPWRDSRIFLWQKLRQALHLGGAEPIVYHDDHELGEWEVQRGETNFNTIAAYRPQIQPSDCPMLLLVSSVRLRGNPLHSPYCGWEPFATKLDAEYLEADHFQMMRDDPHLSRVAGILRKRLE